MHEWVDELLDGATNAPTLPGPAGGSAMRAWRQLADVLDGAALAVLAGWDRSGDWANDGARSVAQWFAAQTHTAKSTAGGFRRLALDLTKHHHVAEATYAGRLSMAHARELIGARRPDVFAEFDRDEAQLTAEAEDLTLEGLRARLLAWRYEVLAAAERNEGERPPGPETDADRLSLHDGFAGRGILDGDLTPEATAMVRDGIDAELDRMRREGALEGDLPTAAELRAEAFLAIFRRGLAAGTSHGSLRPLVVGIADLDTLLRRCSTDPGEQAARRAELVGAGPVPDATIAKLLCDADVGLVLADATGEPLWVGRTKRTATAAQMRALLVRSGGTCEMPGCDAPHSRCQAHHLDHWEHGGPTDIDNMVLLCHHNHQQVHRRGWNLELDGGRLRVFRRDGTEIRTRAQRPPPDQVAA